MDNYTREPEHEIAINALNEMDDTSNFYLLEISTVSIDNSIPAIMFRTVCSPNEVITAIKTEKKSVSKKDEKYINFWGEYKDIDRHIDSVYINIRVPVDMYIMVDARQSQHTAWQNGIAGKYNTAEMYFYDNKELYHHLFTHKQEIETAFGESLEWIEKENIKACRIRSKIAGGINDTDKWVKSNMIW